MRFLSVSILFLGLNCDHVTEAESTPPPKSKPTQSVLEQQEFEKNSWPYFLRHLPVIDAPIVDYTGTPVFNQGKGAGIINYDVGEKDLQQCADALIRLRAEYLFLHGRHSEIGFHFTDGSFYSWNAYRRGLRPIIKAKKIHFVQSSVSDSTHKSLRKYLDIVYTYAGTLSLSRELKTTADFKVGTVIIKGGSPGHCCIIIDEAIDKNGQKVFKLAESFMPAQSIYVLRNPFDPQQGPWHKLSKGPIETASYYFSEYKLGSFE